MSNESQAHTPRRHVDTAYIERSGMQGVTIEAFHICDLSQAINQAANMTAYHGDKFNVVVRNEKRTPMARKKVKLEKSAKWFSDKITVLHENTLTRKLEAAHV